ncbi:hypothetical protein BCR33DRAFT_552377 [Rhizoclosmatium globosum]|uniref:FYVE-domain-containing protein n=1 Tax=Rhizoclosmatium globosum TaxID=329046 RepID=A0A1Y2CRY6_9FUNG|nr:hypothetical protein BCR33DRAFT_552377 [Rhizoclosmatium globosum]|eukprot:ORY49798.1 hypothetical protein BCR33DRAFT_552377 [Rhizoclosmatium globosum]
MSLVAQVEVKGMTCRGLSSSSDEALQHTFQILSPDKSFAAYTDSARSTEEWIRKINNAVVELKSARRSLKTGSEGEDDVNLAPVWLPNKLAASCMICQEAFTWMTRKHHCRKCGNIVCASCSRNRVPGIGTNMLVRACNSCCPQRLIVTSPEPISIQQETQNDYDDVETEEGDSVRSFLSGCGVGIVRARSSRWSVAGGSEMGRDGGSGSQRSLMSFIGGSTGGGGGGERRTSIVIWKEVGVSEVCYRLQEWVEVWAL